MKMMLFFEADLEDDYDDKYRYSYFLQKMVKPLSGVAVEVNDWAVLFLASMLYTAFYDMEVPKVGFQRPPDCTRIAKGRESEPIVEDALVQVEYCFVWSRSDNTSLQFGKEITEDLQRPVSLASGSGIVPVPEDVKRRPRKKHDVVIWLDFRGLHRWIRDTAVCCSNDRYTEIVHLLVRHVQVFLDKTAMSMRITAQVLYPVNMVVLKFSVS